MSFNTRYFLADGMSLIFSNGSAARDEFGNKLPTTTPAPNTTIFITRDSVISFSHTKLICPLKLDDTQGFFP
jgi:hypothetical protein